MSRIPRSTMKRIVHVDPICVECGGRGKMASGEKAFPADPKKRGRVFYVCPCGSSVGCHAGTAVPLGRPASGRTRFLRMKAHEALDSLWGSDRRTRLASGLSRKRVYKWLGRELGLTADETHIGLFDAAQCQQVIDLCLARSPAEAA